MRARVRLVNEHGALTLRVALTEDLPRQTVRVDGFVDVDAVPAGDSADARLVGDYIIDSVALPVMDSVRGSLCSTFRADLEAYLKTRPGVPQTLQQIVDSRRYHVTVADRVTSAARDTMAGQPPPRLGRGPRSPARTKQ